VTARAVQRVLQRLATVDRSSHDYLAAFAKQHPPIAPDFIARLLAEPPGANASANANPAQLASAILVTRAELARDVARSLEDSAARDNVSVLREHLSRHTYVTSNSAAPRLRYRAAGVVDAAASRESGELWRELRRRQEEQEDEGGGGGRPTSR
jgi:hypothetical protein